MDGNAMIPTDAEHDDHHAHACIDCDEPFSRKRPVAASVHEGDLCEECLEERGEDGE